MLWKWRACTTDVPGDDVLEEDRLWVGCEYGSAEDKPIKLSTDRPSYTFRSANRKSDIHGVPTYTASVFNELLPIHFVQSRYSNIIPLGLDQSISQLFIFQTHGFQHSISSRLPNVSVQEK